MARFRFFSQLSFRLFVLIAGLLAISFAIMVHVNYETHREHLLRRVELAAERCSDNIRRATRYAMMINSRSFVREIITAVGGQTNIEAVHLYNKDGEIVVSAEDRAVGRVVDMGAAACVACHKDGAQTPSPPSDELVRRFAGVDGGPVLGLITPIYNDETCSSADCHAHPPEQRILGVLDVQISLREDEADLAENRAEMVRESTLFALGTALLAGLFIFFVVRRPTARLIRATQSIARGDLDVEMGLRAPGEIGALAHSFDKMAKELRREKAQNDEWAATLEAKVEDKTEELRQAQVHLVQMEKMASLGKLSAVVAHEINNPLAGVLTYARLVSRRLRRGEQVDEEARGRLLEHLEVVEAETRRCGDIVKNMLLFSRRKAEGFAPGHLKTIVEAAVRLLRHSLEMSDLNLEWAPGDFDDRLTCNSDQVQQSLVALMVNATEAMESGGTLSVEVGAEGESELFVVVRDTGGGIPPETIPRIFEPFFTTKDAESGVGLGLAVVHGIVERHGGRIEVDSKPGIGTAFRIVLPREPHTPEDGGGKPA